MNSVSVIILFWLLPGFTGKHAKKSSQIAHLPFVVISLEQQVLLGETVEIRCNLYSSEHINLYLYLEKDGQIVDAPNNLEPITFNIFTITNVSLENGGMYSCYLYNSKTSWSYRSESVALRIIDPHLSRPSILVSPSQYVLSESNTTIHCCVYGTGSRKRFYLQTEYGFETLQWMETDGDRASFTISRYSIFPFFEHEKSYQCSYSPVSALYSTSYLSDSVKLIFDDDIPNSPLPSPGISQRRPTISLSPKKEVIIGGNVTIHCKYSEPSHKFFYLQKPGEQLVDELMETEGHRGKFLINNVSKEHGGRYSCTDSYEKDKFSISPPSEPVELVIIDPDLPRPNISIIPNQTAFLGSNITIQCATKGSSKRFYLHKDGGQMEPQLMEPDGETATFSILNIKSSYGGKYKCSYRRPSRSSISSVTSEAMNLLVVDPPETIDFVQINTIRLAIGGVIILLLTYIVISDYFFWKKQEYKMDLKNEVP